MYILRKAAKRRGGDVGGDEAIDEAVSAEGGALGHMQAVIAAPAVGRARSGSDAVAFSDGTTDNRYLLHGVGV